MSEELYVSRNIEIGNGIARTNQWQLAHAPLLALLPTQQSDRWPQSRVPSSRRRRDHLRVPSALTPSARLSSHHPLMATGTPSQSARDGEARCECPSLQANITFVGAKRMPSDL